LLIGFQLLSDEASMNFPQEVDRILDALLSGIQWVLRENLVGVYLRGSLATGDFIPG